MFLAEYTLLRKYNSLRAVSRQCEVLTCQANYWNAYIFRMLKSIPIPANAGIQSEEEGSLREVLTTH